MMKNKAVTYFLILAVVVLWGLIIFRIIDATSGNDDLPVSSPAAIIKKEPLDDYSNLKDTTHLLLSYRDPFNDAAKKDSLEIPVSKLINKNPVTVSTPPKPATNWNFISYSGYVRNARSKKLLSIVTINGREYMMNEGETAAQVKLVKNLRDSIKIVFNGKSKFIAMNTK